MKFVQLNFKKIRKKKVKTELNVYFVKDFIYYLKNNFQKKKIKVHETIVEISFKCRYIFDLCRKL